MIELCCSILAIIVYILIIGALGWATTIPEEELKNMTMTEIWSAIAVCVGFLLDWIFAVYIIIGLYNAISKNNFEKTLGFLKLLVFCNIVGYILIFLMAIINK